MHTTENGSSSIFMSMDQSRLFFSPCSLCAWEKRLPKHDVTCLRSANFTFSGYFLAFSGIVWMGLCRAFLAGSIPVELVSHYCCGLQKSTLFLGCAYPPVYTGLVYGAGTSLRVNVHTGGCVNTLVVWIVFALPAFLFLMQKICHAHEPPPNI